MSDKFCPAGKIECECHYLDGRDNWLHMCLGNAKNKCHDYAGMWAGEWEQCPWPSLQKPVQNSGEPIRCHTSDMAHLYCPDCGGYHEQSTGGCLSNFIKKTTAKTKKIGVVINDDERNAIFSAGYEQCRKDCEAAVKPAFKKWSTISVDDAIHTSEAAIRAVKMEVGK